MLPPPDTSVDLAPEVNRNCAVMHKLFAARRAVIT